MKINPTQLNHIRPLRPEAASAEQQITEAKEVRDAFRSFVGESFFGQMLKSMRSTQEKPAYFHGGQAEEVFRGQLDQTLAQEMTKASADQFADPMFWQQFPMQAEILRQAEENEGKMQSSSAQPLAQDSPRSAMEKMTSQFSEANNKSSLADLTQLTRR